MNITKAFVILIGIITLTSCGPSVVLDAKLIDDLSAIDLTLYENNEFNVHAHWALGTTFEQSGKYKLDKNMIIFTDPPFDNDFIPDTLYIIGNNVIREFNDDGSPNLQFARYFEISTNRIKE
jgi:hypothetical protein